MAEPAFQLPEEDRPVTRPNLRALEGSGEGGEGQPGFGGPRGVVPDGDSQSGGADSGQGGRHLSAAPDADEGETGSGGWSPSMIRGKEQFGKEDKDSKFNKNADNRSFGAKSFLKRNRSKFIIGGALGGGVAGAGIGLIFLLLPLKVEHIVTNLQNHFFASSEDAMENTSETLLSRYIKKNVMPALKNCPGSTIDRKCSANPVTGKEDNPVVALYKGWRNVRLENKLAENYGLEFKYNKHTKKYYMKVEGVTSGDGIDITHFKDDNGNLFKQVNRQDARQVVKNSFRDETRWKKIMYRFKVGRLMEEKYGIKRCLVFCGTRDSIADFKDKKVNVAQLFIARRIITPHLTTMGIVASCLFDETCDPVHADPQTTPDGNEAAHGAPESEVDGAARKKFVEFAATQGVYDKDTIDKMVKDYKTISEKGYQKYFVEQAMEKIGLKALSDKVSSAIPVIGWVTTASGFIARAKDLGPIIAKLRYVAVAPAAVQMYSMYRTEADELHTGNVDASQVGDWANSLGSGNHGNSNDPELGGTAGAEETPLYQSLFNDDGSSGSTTGLLDGVLPAPAFAASKSSDKASNDKCNDGKPIPAGAIVCSELEFGKGSAAGNSVTSLMTQGFIGQISGVAGFIHDATSGVLGVIGDISGFILSHLPFFSDVTKLISDAIAPFFQGILLKVIPNPIGTNMSGGRTFEVVTAGADVSGNDFAHSGLGGRKLSSGEALAIRSQQQNEARQEFERQPLFARMFSTDSQYSLVSQVAMATPSNLQTSASVNFANIISDPFSNLFHSFSSIFSGRASAATGPKEDPFGVTQYGYTEDELPKDPETYWDQSCSDNASQAYQKDNSWNEAAAKNPNHDNGMPQNDTTNPCLLIKAAVGSAGATADSNLLTDDDKADINGAGPPPAPTPPPPKGDCTVDSSKALDLSHLADKVKELCEQNLPKIEGLLGKKTPYKPPHKITFVHEGSGSEEVAKDAAAITVWSSGNVYMKIEWFRANPKDLGVIVHEDTHVVQAYKEKSNTPKAPKWIVEGMADNVQHKLGYTGPRNYNCWPEVTYTHGYTCGAVFLDFIKDKYDASLIADIDKAITGDSFSEDDFFKKQTGYTAPELYQQCLITLCKGGKAL